MSINRRNFIKNCGMIAGTALCSNIFHFNTLKAMNDNNKYFELWGLAQEDMRKLLEFALSKGGDFAELYFEHTVSCSATMQEDIIKSSSESVMRGVGVRVIKDDQTGYGYTNDLSFDKIKFTALTAAAIAEGHSKYKIANLNEHIDANHIYDSNGEFSHLPLNNKIDLIKRAYSSAQKYDNRVKKINASIADEFQIVTIANSEGLLITDYRPQVRLMVRSTAEHNGKRGTAFANNGGRIMSDFYQNIMTPEEIGEKSAAEALILLDAENAPAGELPVVLSKDQSGVMIHEAVGHPLEADANWKGQSIMHDKMGQMVANPLVTIYDDATIPNYRGSLDIDDEGTKTRNVTLLEKGKLVGLLNDKLSAKIMKTEPNGHGRRESYMCPPIPRMNNTILAKGNSKVDEILKSVKKGFYALSYQGGMVENSGKFTFSVNLGYLIENGRLTKPLKNATLIGTNIQILKDIDMIADDTGFFLGTCGKDGQSVPVTAGTPTLRIKKMTVGGVA